jgi:RNA polymerase sigma-70 factor, ECF subfamily
MPQATSDRDLVARSAAGDTVAFGTLVRRYHDRLFRVVVHMVRDRSQADDLVQEAFLRAYRACGRFDGRSEPFTWFYRIAINVSLNHLRSKKRERSRVDSGSNVEDEAAHDGRLGFPQMASPQGAYQDKQVYFELCRGLDQLSESLRVTLILVCVDGLSHEDAASVLGIPGGTIAWRVHEARKKLREHMVVQGFDVEVTA